MRTIHTTVICAALAAGCGNGQEDKTAKDLGPDFGACGTITTCKDPGSPPAKNIQLIPDNGLASGGKTGVGTEIFIKGKNCVPEAKVYLNGKLEPALTLTKVTTDTVKLLLPANPAGVVPGTIQLKLEHNGVFSDEVPFQFTVEEELSGDFRGVVVSKSVEAHAGFPSKPVTAKVFVKGVTHCTAKETRHIRAEVGWAKPGVDPVKEPGWKWTKATFLKQENGHHIYTGQVNVPLVYTYDVAFRFSYDAKTCDDRGTWIYADTDASEPAYEPSKAAKVTSTQAPTDYCAADTDCGVMDRYKAVCDSKKNRCVECVTDADCKKGQYFKGTSCKTSSQTCSCAKDAECAGSLNGTTCVTGSCGCKSDTDCTGGMKCQQEGSCG